MTTFAVNKVPDAPGFRKKRFVAWKRGKGEGMKRTERRNDGKGFRSGSETVIISQLVD